MLNFDCIHFCQRLQIVQTLKKKKKSLKNWILQNRRIAALSEPPRWTALPWRGRFRFLTLQRGQRLLVAVQDDSLLGPPEPGLAGGRLVAVQPLHVELEVSVPVKPAGRRQRFTTWVCAGAV